MKFTRKKRGGSARTTKTKKTSRSRSRNSRPRDDVIVIYPGRFQLFHKGHKAVYDYLKKGFKHVFILTGDWPKTRKDKTKYPFRFKEKKQIMTQLMGIDESAIVQGVNLYSFGDVKKHIEKLKLDIDLESPKVIFAVGGKDMEGSNSRFKFADKKLTRKKNREPSKQQKLRFVKDRKYKDVLHANNINNTYYLEELGNNLTPNDFFYVMEVPTFTFDIRSKPANSATELRKEINKMREKDEEEALKAGVPVELSYEIIRFLNILYDREGEDPPDNDIYSMIVEGIRSSYQ